MEHATAHESPTADSFLAEITLARESDLAEAPERRPVGARPPKMRYNHEAMADLILANPGISQNQIAAFFGRTPSWISTIMTCDAFLSLLAARRAELVDPELRMTIDERLRAMTTQSLKILQEKLSKPADQVSEQLALRALELGAKSLGIGGNAPPPPPPNPAEYLPAIAERLMRLQGRSVQPISDAQIVSGE